MNRVLKAELKADGIEEAHFEKQLVEYQVNGYFANQSIRAFRRFINAGVLDEDAVVEEFHLKRRQVPFLEKELRAAGMLLDAEEVKPAELDLENMEKADLVRLAEKKGVQVKPRATAADIISALRADDGTPV
jgi:hypothetical protein